MAEFGRQALEAAVKSAQAREWDRLLNGIRHALTPTKKSIEVEGIIEVIRELIPLVGPTPWDEVPWPIYLSGLYAQITGGDGDHLPNMAKHCAAVQQMRDHTNQLDVENCKALLRTLQEGN